MHPYLWQTVDAVTDHFRADPRCAGLYLGGSTGKGADDEYSDVDLYLVVEDDAYRSVSAELRPLCERLCGRIQLWFPEGQRPGSCNYAFLFEHDGGQFLYDFHISARSALAQATQRRPERILLDPSGWLATLQAARQPLPYNPQGLAYAIDRYWIYAYLDGKYARRADVLKLLYIQQVLFTVHLEVARALAPDGEWGWWPRDLKRLPPQIQDALLRYFNPPDHSTLHAALGAELGRFAADARAACARWDVPYPESLERYVLRHLREMGAIPPRP